MVDLGNKNVIGKTNSKENKDEAEKNLAVVWKILVNENCEFMRIYISPIIDIFLNLPASTINNKWTKFLEYIHPEYKSSFLDSIQKQFQSIDEIRELNFKMIQEGGKVLDCFLMFQFEKEDDRIYFIGALHNLIKDKKNSMLKTSSEKALKISEKRLKEAQKIAHIGHWELDYRTNEFLWSDEIFNIYEIPPFKDKKKHEILTDKIHKDDKKYVFESFEKALKNKIEYNISHRLSLKNDKIKYVNQRCKTTYDKNGNPKRSVGTIADITRQIENEQKIKRQNEELKILNAEKDNLFAIISHDLKSPFNALLGFSEILEQRSEKYDTKDRKLVSYINQIAQNTYQLLDDLLNWANFQKGKIVFSPKKIDLYDFTREKIKIIENIASTKAIKIENTIAENAEIFADENMLSTIFRNLLTNAIKFTHKGGKISIFIKQKAKKIEISIQDNGIGISAEIQKQLFKIDSQISTQGTESETGTGLGLMLCKDFIEKNGGEIFVKSEVGKGSIFTFSMPKIDI